MASCACGTLEYESSLEEKLALFVVMIDKLSTHGTIDSGGSEIIIRHKLAHPAAAMLKKRI